MIVYWLPLLFIGDYSSVQSFLLLSNNHKKGSSSSSCSSLRLSQTQESWTGDVVPQGKIEGCSLQRISMTEFTVTIDGVQADLGRFSDAIYKKLLQDAKQQRFQGFRPGTIPPHLLSTYKAYAMDECARETVLEALQQNNIRPFENCRASIEFGDFLIPPTPILSKGKNRKKKADLTIALEDDEDGTSQNGTTVSNESTWRSFATMKDALNAGWCPGQSFSFVARKVTGQEIKNDEGATPIARPF